jgi:hypothetical protein
MPFTKSVLVVANVTATSPELMGELRSRAEREPITFTLIVPATHSAGGRAAANAQLGEALDQLRSAGLDVAGEVRDADPLIAISEAWDPKRYDEILISTLPMKVSKWLHGGLPERVSRLTGALVSHVVAEPPRPVAAAVSAPEHEDRGVMLGALSVLRWGPGKDAASRGSAGGRSRSTLR